MPFFAIRKAMLAKPTPTITADHGAGMPAFASAATSAAAKTFRQ